MLLYHKFVCLSNDASPAATWWFSLSSKWCCSRWSQWCDVCQCAVRHTSFAKRTSLASANIICQRQTSFKKATFVRWTKVAFLLAHPAGFEPATYRFVAGHSIRWAMGASTSSNIPYLRRNVKSKFEKNQINSAKIQGIFTTKNIPWFERKPYFQKEKKVLLLPALR